MTWVNIGLESTLFLLQSILLQQLSGIGFAAQDQDIPTNLRILKVAAKDAKILLVLDDLWATELTILKEMGFENTSEIISVLKTVDKPVSTQPQLHGKPKSETISTVISLLMPN